MGTRITPYVSPDEEAKKNQVARMFDGIAHRYDFLNHFFSLGIDVLWRKACIRMLKKEHPQTLLDVATGTADFAIEAVRMGLDVHVSGVDISAGMLEVGREKAAARGWNDRIELIQGDSVALPSTTTPLTRTQWRLASATSKTCKAVFATCFVCSSPGVGTRVGVQQAQALSDQAGVWPVFQVHHAHGGQMGQQRPLRVHLPP